MTVIGKLRTKIYLIQFQGQTSDGYGGLTAGTTATRRTFWGDIKAVSSSREQDQGQQVLSKRYKITARQNPASVVENGNYIIYKGKVIIVTGVVDKDVTERFIEITGEEREVNGAEDIIPITGKLMIEVYTATGGESEFTATALIGKEALIVFEEGSALQVVEAEPGRLQAGVDATTGKVKFDHLLMPDAKVQVLYQ